VKADNNLKGNNLTIEQLRANAAEAVANAKAAVSEKLEIAQLTATIARANNQSIIDATAQVKASEAVSAKLKEIATVCEQTISSMPVFNKKTRENRKWSPSAEYGLGSHMTELTGLLTGIQYSATAHKPYLLAASGLSEDLIESTVEALGSTPYFSPNYGVIVNGLNYNLPKLLTNLAVIESIMDIDLDKSKLTEANLSARMELAQLKAEKALAEYESGQALKEQSIVIE
jgi:hypothetical protein